MYTHSVSLVATHLIGPDANKVLRAYGIGTREGGEREAGGREEKKGLEVVGSGKKNRGSLDN